MAYGDQSAHYAGERIATIADPDVRFIDTSGSVVVNDGHYLVIKHEPLALDVIPVVRIDGKKRAATVFPDGKFVNANRVSKTQTVMKNVSGGDRVIEVLEEFVPFPTDDSAIGQGIIGYTFKVK